MSMAKYSRGHTELNHGPLDLQSNALPLIYTPLYIDIVFLYCILQSKAIQRSLRCDT